MVQRRDFLTAGLAAGLGGLALGPAVRAWAAAPAYKAVSVEDGGRLEGRVAFRGDPPVADKIIIGKDNHICGDGHITPDPLRLSDDGGLQDTVVAITDITRGKAWETTAEREIIQEACAFHPYVQVAPKGIDLKITNMDPLLHNIHAYEQIGRARRTLFNIAQPAAGQVDIHPLKLRRGHIVEIDCDAHNWMSAWIYTLDHPYFAVSDAEGRFAIGDLPGGAYQVAAWHPLLGEVSGAAAVAAGGTAALDLTFDA